MKKKHFYTAVILVVFLVAGIQPTLAVINIPGDTDYYDQVGSTYTLKKDVSGTIQIDASDLTLDGGEFTVTPSSTENTDGIFISLKTGITIMNVTIEKNEEEHGFDTGIKIQESTDITLMDNTISGCDVSVNSSGIWLSLTYGSNLTNNIVSNNSYGIRLSGSYSNIYVGNALTSNTVSNNDEYAIYLSGSTYNTLTLNTISDNYRGIRILGQSDDNDIYNNNFINTFGFHAAVTDSERNVFHLPLPIGGNYWDDWTSPDADNNGVVDNPYTGIYVGEEPPILDDFPWVEQNGWTTPPPPPTPVEAIEDIIDDIEHMDVPEKAEKEMGKAVKELNKAIKEFNKDRIDKAIKKIAKAVKRLEKAQEKGADTQDVIDELLALVEGL